MGKLEQRIGFIGGGNMARAILGGMIKAGMADGSRAAVSDVSTDQLATIAAETGAQTMTDNAGLVEKSDVIIIATKPFHVADVCKEIGPDRAAGKLFISICAGIKTQFIEERLGPKARVVRVMPNTPALIGCGSTAVAGGASASGADVELSLAIFRAVGIAIPLPEDQLDLVTGLTGSGPAYLFYFAESLIRAAEELGMARADATLLVKQLVYGAGRMAAESDKSLDQLRTAVTTKKGTTEAGLLALEEGGFPDLIEECVARATARSRELSAGII
ncbi:MAG: pyrroline-5-carboxylate reductase [Candidatus Sumerlaeaceae bacterium]|nr:pyrroline-5-carboxylate reductase [Candidatus Sumerlaeaceae bacterium]